MKLLTEQEVADLLGCDALRVKRLRAAGLVAFIPGQPALLLEDDVHEFIAWLKRRSEHERSKGYHSFDNIMRLERLDRQKSGAPGEPEGASVMGPRR